ncbi:efflux RND transporter periplasmic adaptor subunit [Oceanobacter antarcticus]|uniref:Efflux RND transporter periplasmic adaptor subunit n=1 Tax=Oceanobacter antarcticus TaxID=3133425 RepID=A0ABW8NFP8_9GAMM
MTLTVTAGLFWWWSSRPVTVYKTEPLATGNIEAVVAAIGTVEPRDSVNVGVQVSGQITYLHVKPGDTVEKGQLLAEIDASVLEAVVDAGRAELAMLKAQLQERQAQVTLASQQHKRQQRLFVDGATPEEEVQTAQANLTVAMAQVKQLQASIQQTQSQHKADTARLGYTRIYAPMAGTVLTIDVKEGQTLNANYQTPALLQIADLSTMRIQAKVSEADIHRIQPGLPVRFNTLGNSERTWHSKVDQVLPAPPKPTAEDSTEARAVTYTVLFDVNNHDGALMPGMTTETDFVVTAANDVPVAPLAALMPESSANGLYLAQVLLPDGNTEQRRINVGRRDRLRVEVLAGLQPGEQMVVSTRKYARRRDSW